MVRQTAASHRDRWSRRLYQLVRPSPRLTNPDLRRRSALHSALVLVLILGALGSILVEESAHGFFHHFDAAHAIMYIGLAALVVAYALSRTRYYTFAATLTVLTISTLVWRLWAVDVVEDPGTAALYFTALPLILSALLLSPPMAAAFVALTLASVLMIPWFAATLGAAPPEDLVFNLATYVLLVSALMMMASYLLDQGRRRIATQATALEEANARLRDMEKTRVQFLNQAAHDLASPLTPVKIQLDILRRVSEANPQIPIEPSITMMTRNMALFERLLGDIRDLARLEAGRLSLERGGFDLSKEAAEVVAFYEPVARPAGVTIQTELSEAAPVVADRRRVHQILNNLVSNAIKFTPAGGHVVVKVARRGSEVVVSVSDNGRGLAPDEIIRLFKPFSQVHEPSEVRERGTGLGLFICKGFVEAHGGQIWVESRGRGEGSTFSFTLGPEP